MRGTDEERTDLSAETPHADEILADCPDCELGNLKAENAGLDGEERILRCSYVECGRVVKSYQDDWPDHVSTETGNPTERTANFTCRKCGDPTDLVIYGPGPLCDPCYGEWRGAKP